MSDFSKLDAVDFFAAIFDGRHHIPGAKNGADNVKPYGEGWCVALHGAPSTYDDDVLTRLVILAHDRCVRVEMSSAGRHLRIAIHKRPGRTGGVWDRHPTIETAIETWRRYCPTPSPSATP